MTHRVEQIMQAITTACTGLVTTGANVYRARPYNVEAAPCLFISMGQDEKLTDLSQGSQDWMLTVEITGTVKLNTQLETAINTIRAEVHVALRTTYSQGLSFVQDTIEENPDQIQTSGDAQNPTASQKFVWNIRYRRLLDNPN